MLQVFKDFAMKGNVVDLAIGVIIGAAFGKIVDSVVNDLIMPIVGAILGGLDFSNIFLGLAKGVTATNLADAQKQGAVFAYGHFITIVINFIIIAFILFMIIKALNASKKPAPAAAPAAPPPASAEVVLLTQIRDALAKR